MARIYGTASERANQWLLDQGYSQGQLNDAYDKIREKQKQGMSSFDIMDDIRQNRKDYIDNPMYGSSSSYDNYDSGGGEDEYVPTWEELHPAVNRNVGGKDFNLQSHEDGSITVTVGGQERTIDKNHSQYNTISNYLNGITSKQTSTNPNTTGNESGLGDQVTGVRDSKWWTDYDNRVDSNLKKGMSREDAFNEASEWMKRDTISSSKQDKEAESQGPKKDDDVIDNNTLLVDQVPTDESTEDAKYNKNEDPTNGEMDGEGYSDEEKEWFKNLFGFYPEEADDFKDSLQSWADNITNNLESSSTNSKVVNNASVPRESSYNFNTYFEDLIPDKNVGVTGAAKQNKETPAPLTDVTQYQDSAISSLQSLGFLEPNTEASETMPATEEQTPIETDNTPEGISEGLDNSLSELESTNGLTPQAAAQTYVNYKNRLAKYIKDNNISDEEAAAMFDQLKSNEKLNELLKSYKK